jgi:hypothetical protein
MGRYLEKCSTETLQVMQHANLPLALRIVRIPLYSCSPSTFHAIRTDNLASVTSSTDFIKAEYNNYYVEYKIKKPTTHRFWLFR